MNRVLRRALPLVVWFTLAGLCQSEATDWPRLRGPYLAGTSPDPILLSWPANGLPVAWRLDSPVGYGSVAVSGGKVFTLVLRWGSTNPYSAVEAGQ
ncbi:MAG: hypothetical protein ABSH34_10350 [Verrucomicrobiota bacterium]|jgi:hypothetical protein